MTRTTKTTTHKSTAKKSKRFKALRGRFAKLPSITRWVAIFLLLTVVIALLNYDLLLGMDSGKIMSGVHVGPIDASGKTYEETKFELNNYLQNYNLNFITPSGTETVGPFTGDAKNIVEFHTDTAIKQAYEIGRSNNIFVSLIQRLSTSILGSKLEIPYSLNEESLQQELESRFAHLISPVKNASFKISVNKNETHVIEVESEQAGMTFKTEPLMRATRDKLRELSNQEIKIEINLEQPKIKSDDLNPLIPKVEDILKITPIQIKAKELSWNITKAQLADWITVEENTNNKNISVALNEEKVARHLESYASSLAKEPINAIFELNEDGNRVINFSPSIDGEILDLPTSINLLNEYVLSDNADKNETLELPVTVARPEITTAKSNQFGISSLIGNGASNFRGSPANRRHNIKTGADALDGLLIAPGEEFSLVTALGDIDAENGYLEELVIKQNETKPEFGGGLCQIGTTAFRTVLDAGLPVTERRNHSYRVSYYERDGDGNYIGPGKDATIYDPWPDFKFLNDTNSHLLIQTEITGDRIDFYFWGEDDGRVATQGDVTIWNINDPPPKKEIFTTDLEPGKWRCTESPHASASTVFTYTVAYANGEEKEEKFYSYYRPWQEVCLVGVTEEELAEKENPPDETTPEGSGIEEIPPEG